MSLGLFEKKLKERLGNVSPDRVVFVGVGNRYRGDDAIGPVLIDLLAGKVSHAIDSGTTPENLTGAIKKLKPAVIVFIDALFLKDLPPGTPALLESDDIRHLGSSHVLSLDTIMDYLKDETRADVFLIGVQPESVEYREGMSIVLLKAAEKIARLIIEAIGNLPE